MKKSHSLMLVTALGLIAACGNRAGAGAPVDTPASASASASASTPGHASSTTLASETATSLSSPTGLPHFATPQAAARYLAEKWNTKDDAALHHITNDESRFALADMRTFASADLAVDGCAKNENGTYTCTFTHGFLPGKEEPDSVPTDNGHDGPAPSGDPHHGRTALKAVAVDRTGWYFNVFLYCG